MKLVLQTMSFDVRSVMGYAAILIISSDDFMAVSMYSDTYSIGRGHTDCDAMAQRDAIDRDGLSTQTTGG